jgi:hypothetical protein
LFNFVSLSSINICTIRLKMTNVSLSYLYNIRFIFVTVRFSIRLPFKTEIVYCIKNCLISIVEKLLNHHFCLFPVHKISSSEWKFAFITLLILMVSFPYDREQFSIVTYMTYSNWKSHCALTLMNGNYEPIQSQKWVCTINSYKSTSVMLFISTY